MLVVEEHLWGLDGSVVHWSRFSVLPWVLSELVWGDQSLLVVSVGFRGACMLSLFLPRASFIIPGGGVLDGDSFERGGGKFM